ncbi:hypothetical protein LSH36_1478g00036 [Paralvinella palmiformis]|uniref:Tyrosine-protein phosphatase domain-containing protein n=1 Tax=Paralvinella palmiformis TaxID=53620 RepID=A0AAD9ISJ4_9ANNE|nr:hypothetical protein LSH36_1478g00036 [Paralvinella palmiformis]
MLHWLEIGLVIPVASYWRPIRGAASGVAQVSEDGNIAFVVGAANRNRPPEAIAMAGQPAGEVELVNYLRDLCTPTAAHNYVAVATGLVLLCLLSLSIALHRIKLGLRETRRMDLKTCLRYWPKDEHTKEHYGQVEVELTSVNVEDFLIIRDLKVTEIAKTLIKPEVLMVRQFQLLSWPSVVDLPPNNGHLLELMDKLQKWQHINNIAPDHWKPLIHCIDGGSHSGMFCGASFLLERMKIEHDVNAVLTVRYVSRHRSQFFHKLVCTLMIYN